MELSIKKIMELWQKPKSKVVQERINQLDIYIKSICLCCIVLFPLIFHIIVFCGFDLDDFRSISNYDGVNQSGIVVNVELN